jgi:hypothetical protein
MVVDGVNISNASMSELYTLIMLKVSTFHRFSDRWHAIGSMTGHAIVTQYDPTTFVQDFIRDMSTVAEPMDRPTAVQVFAAIVHYVKTDESMRFKQRSAWVHAYHALMGTDVPAPYDAASVAHGIHEGERPAKRDHRAHVNADRQVLDDNEDIDNLSDSMSANTLTNTDDDPVAAIKALPTLNASTV